MLELEDLEVRYGAVTAVRGLSMRLDPGEIVGLIGPNGAGKSTTLHAILGLVPAHGGDIRLAGRSIRGRAPEAVVRSGIALVPEGRRIYAHLTVEENLRLGLAGRRSSEGVDEDFDWVFGLFPIVQESSRRQAGTLSGGQQQQLALAKAILLEPALLCIDELSLGLAPVTVEALLAVVRSIADRGVTLVLVEQSLNIAASLCERAVFLEKGEVRFEGQIAELLERKDIARAVFFGETQPPRRRRRTA
jgi:branched-chain amino acid transport system ATP-binding protein